MKAMDSQSNQIPAFLNKLWMLLDNKGTQDLIRWDEEGASFHVLDQARFSKEVLPQYFKHNNMASFVRQLNMYGFRKVTSIDQGALRTDKEDMQFHHPYFLKDHPEILEMIKRKAAKERIAVEETRLIPSNLDQVLSDVRQMKGKQDSVTNKLQSLKKENEALWREVASLRQKHARQQQIVNKLIQFLLTVAGARRNSLKRNLPLMIEGSGDLGEPDGAAATGNKRRKPDATAIQAATTSAYTVVSGKTADVAVATTSAGTAPVHKDKQNVPGDSNSVASGSILQGSPAPYVVDIFDSPLGDINDSLIPLNEDCDTEQDSWVPASNVDNVPPSHPFLPPNTDDLSQSLDGTQFDLDSIREMFSSNAYQLDASLLLGLFNPDVAEVPVVPEHISAFLGEDSELIKGNELVEYHPPDMDGIAPIIYLDDIAGLADDPAGDENSLDASNADSPLVSSSELD